ncbi:UTRA domain-containing protein [Lactobacillus panisapium]|uniref:UTRA domain-containing protein n=1 Tax=Lactobacillus panisapium TaxID=2012495 RepID=UPI00215DA99F|nr:UTRA domain-containing protein [Lactobacillus panisapium]
MSPESKVWYFERVRIVNYKIEQLERSIMPLALFPDLSQDNIEGSIQHYVENKGAKNITLY